jgi:hypothetical protein
MLSVKFKPLTINVIMLYVIIWVSFCYMSLCEFHFAICHFAEYHNVVCHYIECQGAHFIARESYWRAKLSTVDLSVLTSLDQLLFILKILFTLLINKIPQWGCELYKAFPFSKASLLRAVPFDDKLTISNTILREAP